MGYFKLPLFFVGFTALSLGANSMENEVLNLEGCLEKLREKFDVIKNNTYPGGYPLPSEADILAIENKLGYPLPNSLKEFYNIAGNLRLENFRPAVPNGGDNSALYNLIRDGQEKMLGRGKSDWLPFCKANGFVEFFCIHIVTGEIRRYVEYAGFEKEEVYSSLSDWIIKSWLSEAQL